MVCFIVLYSSHSLGGIKDTKALFKYAGCRVEIRTGLLPSASVRRYRHASRPDVIVQYVTRLVCESQPCYCYC